MSEFTEYNFHTHTYRCKHASGTEREYIESAIQSGMKALGFADHVPCPFKEPGRVSGIRMDMSQAPEYVGCIRELAKEYQNDIKVYVGFEAEYILEFIDEQVEMCRDLKCDYLIMGPHFLTGEVGVEYTGQQTASPERIITYVDSVLEGASKGYFAYIAHPDLLNFIGDKELYVSEMNRLCEGLKEMDVPIEMNNLGMAANRHYPTPLFWEIAGKVGNKTVIGLDAHNLKDMVNKEAYHRCMDMINLYNVNYISDADTVIGYLERSKKILLG